MLFQTLVRGRTVSNLIASATKLLLAPLCHQNWRDGDLWRPPRPKKRAQFLLVVSSFFLRLYYLPTTFPSLSRTLKPLDIFVSENVCIKNSEMFSFSRLTQIDHESSYRYFKFYLLKLKMKKLDMKKSYQRATITVSVNDILTMSASLETWSGDVLPVVTSINTFRGTKADI